MITGTGRFLTLEIVSRRLNRSTGIVLLAVLLTLGNAQYRGSPILALRHIFTDSGLPGYPLFLRYFSGFPRFLRYPPGSLRGLIRKFGGISWGYWNFIILGRRDPQNHQYSLGNTADLEISLNSWKSSYFMIFSLPEEASEEPWQISEKSEKSREISEKYRISWEPGIDENMPKCQEL